MKQLTLITLLIFCCYSKTKALSDSVATEPHSKFIFALDFRNSFVRNSPVSIYGVQFGKKFYDRHIYAIGLYTLSGEAKQNFRGKTKDQKMKVLIDLQLLYGTFSYAYSVINTKKFELSLPLELGWGISRSQVLDLNENPLPGIKPIHSSFVPLGAGLKIDWRLTRWIGLAAMSGYRLSILESDIRSDFDGMYYNVSAAIYIGNIMNDYKAWRKRKAELKNNEEGKKQ